MKKAEWERIGSARLNALKDIADMAGKGHPIHKMLGSIAWRRHPWESGPNSTLQSAIVLASALDGVYNTINLWARDNDGVLQRRLIARYQEARHNAS